LRANAKQSSIFKLFSGLPRCARNDRKNLPTTNHKLQTNAGFTLVELAIVIVIIGLLVGGVLQGQELIKQARMQSGLTQIGQYMVAYNNFKMKYNCLPGDCRTATTFFPSSAQPERVTNGNGDNIINASSSGNLNGWEQTEMYYVWDHLAASGLVNFLQYDETPYTTTVNEVGTGYPESKFSASGSITGGGAVVRSNSKAGILIGNQQQVGYISGGNVMHIGMCKFSNWGGAYSAGECGLNPWEAFYIDQKMDNGIPVTGKIIIVPNGFYMTPSNGFSSGVPLCSTASLDAVTGNIISEGAYYREDNLPSSSYLRSCRVQIQLE
jgi:prepilin-type N-terminal cleavage/methylation domain-containing protein